MLRSVRGHWHAFILLSPVFKFRHNALLHASLLFGQCIHLSSEETSLKQLPSQERLPNVSTWLQKKIQIEFSRYEPRPDFGGLQIRSDVFILYNYYFVVWFCYKRGEWCKENGKLSTALSTHQTFSTHHEVRTCSASNRCCPSIRRGKPCCCWRPRKCFNVF